MQRQNIPRLHNLSSLLGSGPPPEVNKVCHIALHNDMRKVKSNYLIMRPKVDQRAGLLSLPHLRIFAIYTRYFLNLY